MFNVILISTVQRVITLQTRNYTRELRTQNSELRTQNLELRSLFNYLIVTVDNNLELCGIHVMQTTSACQAG